MKNNTQNNVIVFEDNLNKLNRTSRAIKQVYGSDTMVYDADRANVGYKIVRELKKSNIKIDAIYIDMIMPEGNLDGPRVDCGLIILRKLQYMSAFVDHFPELYINTSDVEHAKEVLEDTGYQSVPIINNPGNICIINQIEKYREDKSIFKELEQGLEVKPYEYSAKATKGVFK